MPNGLGIGGQFEYWGLWLDSEYGIGECSETCTTYKNYVQLSATKQFKIRNVEVWGVGDKPVKEDEVSVKLLLILKATADSSSSLSFFPKQDDEGQSGSVLDRDTESKAILKIAGRELHSDGYREMNPHE